MTNDDNEYAVPRISCKQVETMFKVLKWIISKERKGLVKRLRSNWKDKRNCWWPYRQRPGPNESMLPPSQPGYPRSFSFTLPLKWSEEQG